MEQLLRIISCEDIHMYSNLKIHCLYNTLEIYYINALYIFETTVTRLECNHEAVTGGGDPTQTIQLGKLGIGL